jgi:cytidylate kinase
MSSSPSPPTGAPSNDLRIAISGKSGCGNSTVSRIVAARLGMRLVNYTFKDLARDRGLSFEEVCRLAESDPEYCVLGSRLAIWLLRDTALTVYLEAGLEARAARIARREGIPLPAALAETAERDRRDHDRYLRLYGYDVDTYRFADLLIDAETLDQEAVASLIVESALSPGGR